MASFCPSYVTFLSTFFMIYDPYCLRELRQTGDVKQDCSSSLLITMSSTEFCIKWTNYQSNIVNSVGKLKNEDEFVDVTLVCEEQSIRAHKVILSACSDYFKQVFKVRSS